MKTRIKITQLAEDVVLFHAQIKSAWYMPWETLKSDGESAESLYDEGIRRFGTREFAEAHCLRVLQINAERDRPYGEHITYEKFPV